MRRIRRRMAPTIVVDHQSLSLQIEKACSNKHGGLVEEIEGLIKVYKDRHVERPQIVPSVSPSAMASKLGVTSKDMVIDKFTNLWARFYVPNNSNNKKKLPLIVYFHGGGFCVGSAAWSCYHEFLSKLAAIAGCFIMSVNYRLAPENPLPAAYEDGLKSLTWLKQHPPCEFSNVFLAGDSAGANIAHNVAAKLGVGGSHIKAMILIQPFFGGEARTDSEKNMVQPPRSALTLAASDTYWRLALPCGANRDHPWCNPLAKWSLAEIEETTTRVLPTLVCIAEMDILRDRNLEFCSASGRKVKKVEIVLSKGVGHGFQVLSKSQLSQTRTLELITNINNFIHQE